MIKKIFFVIILLIVFYDLYETLNISNYFYKTKNEYKNIFKINNYESDIIGISDNIDSSSDNIDSSNDNNSVISDNIDSSSDNIDSSSDIDSVISDNIDSSSDIDSVSDNNSVSDDENTKYISKIKANNENIKEIININKNNKIKNDEIIAQQQEIIKYQQNIINQSQNNLKFTYNNQIQPENSVEFKNNHQVFTENNDKAFTENNDKVFTENIIIKHPNQKPKEEKKYNYEEIDINKYGKPYDYKKNDFIHWDFYDPKPWTKIIYTYGSNDPYSFYIKAKIPSLNDYENWKNYLTNINFDPRSGEIIISCQDEETALSIANLVVSNFKGDITFDEIVNKDLIGISIIKCKKYEVVKNKIKEQIIQNMIIKANNFNDLNKQVENKQKQNISKNNENQSNNYFYYNNGLAKKNNDFDAYDGNEYSFI